MTTSPKADIHDILTERFPLAPLADLLAALPQAGALASAETKAADDRLKEMRSGVEALRQQLEAMPPEQLAVIAAQSRERLRAKEAAAKAKRAAEQKAKRDAAERARFYNQPSAAARFEFWCKADYWTVDEAAALLLGRDPAAVNPISLAAELSQPTGLLGLSGRPQPAEFHRSFDELRTLMSRADVLATPRLRPASLLDWAQSAGVVTLPAKLVALLKPHIPEGRAEPVGRATERAAQGTRKRWTPDRLAELAAYRAKYGPAAAAERFGITQTRMRQLLPTETPKAKPAQPYSAFTHRIK